MRFFNSSLKIVQRRTLTPFIGIASIHRHIPDGPVERRYHRNITGVTARLARTVHRPDPEVVGGAVFKAGDGVRGACCSPHGIGIGGGKVVRGTLGHHVVGHIRLRVGVPAQVGGASAGGTGQVFHGSRIGARIKSILIGTYIGGSAAR